MGTKLVQDGLVTEYDRLVVNLVTEYHPFTGIYAAHQVYFTLLVRQNIGKCILVQCWATI